MYVYEFVWVSVPICTQRQEDWQIPLELELYPSICRTPRLFHRFWSPTPSLHECGVCAFTCWGICPAQFYSIILSHALDTKDCLMAFHYRSLSLLFGIGFFSCPLFFSHLSTITISTLSSVLFQKCFSLPPWLKTFVCTCWGKLLTTHAINSKF